MSLFWYSPFPCPSGFTYQVKENFLHIAMGMTQNLTLVGTMSREHKGEKIIKSQKCVSRRFPKERPA
jgi:hypothetical protein